jgi:menaquinone-dependent protoporphyrinogen oxidase
MRVLVTWGSRYGGTAGIARLVAAALEDAAVELRDARHLDDFAGFDAAIIGGALYGNHWHRDARRFVHRHLAELRRVPVWLFSSGPLGDSASRATVPAVPQVAVLMDRLGALGHATFGGRLTRDVTGWLAHAIARHHSGDWRNQAQIRAWAIDIAARLSTARPAPAFEPPARAISRLVAHAVGGWSLCAIVMAALAATAGPGVALAVHALAAPLVFAAIARAYFGAHGARDPLPVAIAFTAIVGALDLVIVATWIQRSFAIFSSVAATWLPLGLIFLATWATGAIMSTMPWPRPSRSPSRHASVHG